MISVVVPTMESREEVYEKFLEAWEPLFSKHEVILVTVYDGDEPKLSYKPFNYYTIVDREPKEPTIEFSGDGSKKVLNTLIFNKNDGVRNYGFYFLARYYKPDIIITLDDDTLPLGDTIQDHLDALNRKVPITWMNTASEYMRGFPYNKREEAEVVLSHGVWQGVADWDAPTQLVKGNRPVDFYKGVIPKGVFYPMCGMNIAFKRCMLPYMYYAPMGPKVGLDRFADIWAGIESKKIIDENNWAVVTGYATVRHERASNVWKNLQKEAKGLEMNENYGEDEYFKLYKEKREAWEQIIRKYV